MALDHPLYRLLHDEPNPEMSSFVFRETLMTHLLLWGNAYVWKDRSRSESWTDEMKAAAGRKTKERNANHGK